MPARGGPKERRLLPRELHEQVEGLERDAGISKPPSEPAERHHFLVVMNWEQGLFMPFYGHGRAEARRAVREAVEYAMAHPTRNGEAWVGSLTYKGCDLLCRCCLMECECLAQTVGVPAGVKGLSVGPIDGHGKSWDIEKMREEAEA